MCVSLSACVSSADFRAFVFILPDKLHVPHERGCNVPLHDVARVYSSFKPSRTVHDQKALNEIGHGIVNPNIRHVCGLESAGYETSLLGPIFSLRCGCNDLANDAISRGDALL